MTTTPPCSSVLRTPSAPLHGAGYDTYEPYSPRESSKTRQLASARQVTPEPDHSRGAKQGTKKASLSKSQHSPHHISPPASTRSTSRKNPKRSSKTESHTTQHSESTADERGLDAPSLGQPSLQPTTLLPGTTMGEGMLPTPVKTPRKKQVANVDQAARALFPNHPESLEDVMPTPKRGRKGRKFNGYSLESFEVDKDSNEPKIEIFTDSKDRIPELDESEDNPFYIKPGSTKRRKVSGERKRDEDVEEHLRQNDGIVYVHRGRKFFYKFDEDEEEEELDPEAEAMLAENNPLSRPRPLTRSSVKPRLLFPTEEQRREREARDSNVKANVEEEEADTDIEGEEVIADDGSDLKDASDKFSPQTTAGDVSPDTIMPNNTSTSSTIMVPDSASPLMEGRSLRSSKKDAVPENQSSRGSNGRYETRAKVSPFSGWKRLKNAVSHKGKNKRTNEEVAESSSSSKKAKSR